MDFSPSQRPHAIVHSESLRACFGVGCTHHHRCARYEAVTGSQPGSDTLGTCLDAGRYPMFIQILRSN